MDAFEFHLPVDEYRTLPVPFYGLGDGRQPKLATCFVRASEILDALKEWMSVNPRIPRFNNKDELTGSVARAIVTTLPANFIVVTIVEKLSSATRDSLMPGLFFFSL